METKTFNKATNLRDFNVRKSDEPGILQHLFLRILFNFLLLVALHSSTTKQISSKLHVRTDCCASKVFGSRGGVNIPARPDNASYLAIFTVARPDNDGLESLMNHHSSRLRSRLICSSRVRFSLLFPFLSDQLRSLHA